MRRGRRSFLLLILTNLTILSSISFIVSSNIAGMILRNRRIFQFKRSLKPQEIFLSAIKPITLDRDAKDNIYGGASDKYNIYLPLTKKNVLRVYDIKSGDFKLDYDLGPLTNADLAIQTDDGLLIGCSDSCAPILINKNKSKEKIVLPTNNFHITAFSKSKDGKVIMGNLNGDPFLLYKGVVKQLKLGLNTSYASTWLNNEYALISSPMQNRILLLKIDNMKANIIKSLNIQAPYRFSPFNKNKVILTSINGSNIYQILISEKNKKIDIKKVDKYYVDSRLLNNNYIEYLNDVAWLGHDGGFAVTTRTGGSILVFSEFNKLVQIHNLYGSMLTRFISSREPDNQQLFVDKSNGSIYVISLVPGQIW